MIVTACLILRYSIAAVDTTSLCGAEFFLTSW